VGVRLCRPLHRRGLGACGQGRDRFAELQPVYDAVIHRWGRRLDADVARGLQLQHDWGPQYRSAHFTGSLAWLDISDDPAFLGESETNGCAERWIRTLKKQCLWA
jgi:putative transposase